MSSNMHMRSLNKNNNRNKKQISYHLTEPVRYMLLAPGTRYWETRQHIDHVDNQLFLHQNGKGVAALLRSKISLYERCNRKGNIDISLKLHKKLRINNVEEEHSSFYMIANRTIDLLRQRLKLWLLIRLQQYYYMTKVLAKSGVRLVFVL